MIEASPVFEDVWHYLNLEKEPGSFNDDEIEAHERGQTIYKYKMIKQEGSSRSTKTWSNFYAIHLWARTKKNNSILVLRDTIKSCKDIVEKDFKKFLIHYDLKKFYTINKTDRIYTIKSTGSFIKFTGADNEDGVMGDGNDIVWWNEPYLAKENVFKQLAMRSRRLLVDMNPKQNHFLDKWSKRKSTKTLYSTFRLNKFIHIEQKKHILSYMPLDSRFIIKKEKFFYEKYISIDDDANEYHHISEEFKFKIENLKNIKNYNDAEKEINSFNLSEFEKKQIRLGYQNEIQGTASRFDWEVYGLGLKSEAENRVFKGWNEITNEDYDNIEALELWGLDFGVIDPTTLVSVKYNDGCVYVKLHVYKPESKMIYEDGTQYELADYLMLNSTLRPGTHTYTICDSSDNDKYSDENKVEKLRGKGINAFKVSKPRINERINVLKKLKVFYVQNEDFENEYEVAEWEQVIRNGKIISRPNPLKPDHALDAFGYIVYNMYQEGMFNFLDEDARS